MTDITHPQLVAALVKPPQDIMNTLSQHTTDLWHGATGVAGETGELLEGLVLVVTSNATVPEGRINVVEELGDLFFYIEQICQRVKLALDWDAITAFARNQHLGPDMMLMYGAQCSVYGSQVLDTIKKAAIYNKELDMVALTTQLTECSKYAITIGYMFGVERTEALRENIAKLSKRYEKLKYSDGAAHARADKAPERKFFGRAEETPLKVPLDHAPGNPDE